MYKKSLLITIVVLLSVSVPAGADIISLHCPLNSETFHLINAASIKQMKKGGPVTLTDSKMSRFVMSIKEASKLVLKATIKAKGGEIFILKMPAIS